MTGHPVRLLGYRVPCAVSNDGGRLCCGGVCHSQNELIGSALRRANQNAQSHQLFRQQLNMIHGPEGQRLMQGIQIKGRPVVACEARPQLLQ